MGHRLNILVLMVFALAGLSMLGGCNTAGCTDNQNSLPLAGFYSSATKASLRLDSVEIYGIGAPGDSMLYTPGTPIVEAYMPFRSTATSTSFCIRYCNRELDLPELIDTLAFDYTSMPFFAGEECGAMYRYNIHHLGYTTHLIDSVEIVDSLITNKPIQQIKIYFKTAEAEEGGEQ